MLLLDDLIIAGTEYPTGSVYAFDPDTCLVHWRRPCGRGVAGAVVGGEDRVYAVTVEDTVLCLDTYTGETIWTYASGATPADTSANVRNKWSPCLLDNRLLYVDLAGTLIALDEDSGDVSWTRTYEWPLGVAVFSDDRYAYLGSKRSFYQIDAETGEERSKVEDLFATSYAFKPTFGDAGIAAVAWDSTRTQHFAAIDHDLGRVLWEQDAPDTTRWTSLFPTTWDGLAVAGTDSGVVLAYEFDTGERAWSVEVEGKVKSLWAEGDRLYVGTVIGTLYAFER